MNQRDRISEYLLQCRVGLPYEHPGLRVPPLPEEARALIAELNDRGLSPAIVGSVAVFHHLGVDAHEYRPTADLDIWVNRDPGDPLPSWQRDPTSPGVVTWISPSRGFVDFLVSGQTFPAGNRTPLHVRRAAARDDAELIDLLSMKLNTMRERDLSDSISLCRALGRIPDERVFGSITEQQKENLALVRLWLTRSTDLT